MEQQELIDQAFQNFVNVQQALRNSEVVDAAHSRRARNAAILASTIMKEMYPDIKAQAHFHNELEQHGLAQPLLTSSQWRRVERHCFANMSLARNFDPTPIEFLAGLLEEDPRIKLN